MKVYVLLGKDYDGEDVLGVCMPQYQTWPMQLAPIREIPPVKGSFLKCV